jgi:hypothetical protein
MKKAIGLIVIVTVLLLILLPESDSKKVKKIEVTENLQEIQTTPTVVPTPSLVATIAIVKPDKSKFAAIADSNESQENIEVEAGQAEGVIVYDSRLQEENKERSKNYDEKDSDNASAIHPAIDALNEIAREPGRKYPGNFFGGARISNTPVPTATVLVVPTATPTKIALKPVSGQARGYTMLYLMQPNARQSVEKQITAMIDSQVQGLYLGVLIDGTFGRDFNYLLSIIRKIERAKRSLTLVLYLTNGPAMRNKDRPKPESPFSDLDPIEFRDLIQNDDIVRDAYLELIKPIVPVLQLNRRLNTANRNYVVVMLEDNLDDASYLAMKELTETVTSNRATFIRNPCPGCVEGNTSDGFGDGIELHSHEDINTLSFIDGYSLDGEGHDLPGKEVAGQLTYEQTRNLALTAVSRGLRYFGLWRFERQGLKIGGVNLPPDERTYEVPSDQDIEAEIALLRAGLSEVEQ